MEERRCPVCLEADGDLLPTGCACRGSGGLAHPGCIAQAAGFMEDEHGPRRWIRCMECGQRYGGRFQISLLDRMVQRCEAPGVPWWRACAARLWRGVAYWEQHSHLKAEVDIRVSKGIFSARKREEQQEPGSKRQLRDINYHLALVCEDTGRYDEARALFQESAALSRGTMIMCLCDLEIARCIFLQSPDQAGMCRYVRLSNTVMELLDQLDPDQRRKYQVALRSVEFILRHDFPVAVVDAAETIASTARRIMGPDHVDTVRARALCDKAAAWQQDVSRKRSRRPASVAARKKIRAMYK